MSGAPEGALPRWSVVVPIAAIIVLAATYGRAATNTPALILAGVALVSAVLAAVHHAEVVALRVGEPFGTLILALAVTVIEVGLILMLMTSSTSGAETLARDTVFSAFMIVCNGVVGLCLLVGGLKHRIVSFRMEGVTAALATLTAMATLALVLPSFTTSSPGPQFTGPQLAFAGVACLALYAVFVFTQTVRHRAYFLPVPTGPGGSTVDDEGDEGADPPTNRATLISLGLLVLCLVGVVGLAKTASAAIERGVNALGAPPTVVGVCIALLVLLPETGAALRAASRNRLQTSLNLAYGSSLASIGLTVPALAVASIWIATPLTLGLDPKDLVLMALTVVVSILTVAPGRATLLQGSVHLVIFGAFLFLAVTP